MTLGNHSSGTYINNSILNILVEQDLLYRISYFTCEYFKDYSINMVHNDDLNRGLVTLFKQLLEVPYRNINSREHRDFIISFNKYVPELNKYVNELFDKWFSNIYTDHLPKPTFICEHFNTKRSIQVVKLSIYVKTTNINIDRLFRDDTEDWPHYTYNSTELLNIIVYNL